MYLNILILPFLSFLISGLLGNFFGRKIGTYFSIFLIGLTFILSLFIFYEIILCQSSVTISLYHWIIIGSFQISIGFLFDSLTSIMLVIILLISFLVHLYSLDYMSHDPHLLRFISYLSLFTFFMLILVTADNFLQLFVGWEGVGVCSYLLINFWFSRILANKAALKAMIINRITDVFFIIGICLILLTFKSVDYSIVLNLVPYFQNLDYNLLNTKINVLTLISFFLLLGL